MKTTNDGGRDADRGGAARLALPGIVLSLVEEAVTRRRHELLRAAAVVVEVAVTPAGQRDARGVVVVVVPHRVEAVAAGRGRSERVDALRLVLRHEHDGAGEGGAARRRGELGNDVRTARVVHRLRRVEPQAVEMELADPVLGVPHHELAHRRGMRPVEIDRVAPLVVVAVGEVVGAELAQVAAVRTEVVVDHVEDDAEPHAVRGVDEALERVGIAVAVVRREQGDAVIAPVEAAGEFRHRHDLEHGYPKVAQSRQLADRGIEGPVGGERADVQLVDHLSGQRYPAPGVVGPREGSRVDDERGAVRPLRLEARERVRIG